MRLTGPVRTIIAFFEPSDEAYIDPIELATCPPEGVEVLFVVVDSDGQIHIRRLRGDTL